VNLWGYGHAAPERGWCILLKNVTNFFVIYYLKKPSSSSFAASPVGIILAEFWR
jgi:hypothetical protein